ncbi:MAG: transcriptional regulator, LysR family [Hyphomicrobiales bacterium]|nr:transcriptional regulator, LysR family [Hyphomicrobiales bacterium]
MVFKAVVDQGGFTSAARRLNISPSAATKNLSALENELGVQLLNRSTRRVALTDYGREFYQSCTEILASLEEAEAALRAKNTAAKGLVRMVMPYSFGRVTFTPELPAFFAEHPEIRLDVHFSDDAIDIIKEGFDLAVRSRELEDSQLIQRVLHKGPVICVASPDYLARHGTPSVPDDLKDHACIVGNYGSEWRFQSADGLGHRVTVNSVLTLRNGDAVREAAVAGLGVAQSTWWLFRKDLQEGKLVPVLDAFEREAVPISVCYPARKHVPQKVAAVLGFLKSITAARRSESPQLAAAQ